MGSGAGLVLLLVSCFNGEESAMELWLLLSSVGERTETQFKNCDKGFDKC